MLSILSNPVNACLSVCLFARPCASISPGAMRRIGLVEVLLERGDQNTFLPSAHNFIVTHPRQTIIDKNIGELLSSSYFKAATVGNTVKGFKEIGIEPHNPLVFSEHDFAASKTTDHEVVGDETENNRANTQSLVVENEHINLPKES
ncbi:DDE-1 domain-containing protein [Trichonephila clavipes]|nr:DDE-1 domain-containing protein [Trichonephila clavipes]